MRQLREWNGGRLGLTLERMLGDRDRAALALDAALDDIWRHAGEHRSGGIDAEDWVFGRLRLVAQAFQAAQPSTRHLRAVQESAPEPTAPARPPVAPAPGPPDGGIEPDSPALANSRIRRPSAPVQSRPIASLREIEDPAPRAGWLRTAALWLGAGAIGFAVSFLALYWLTAEPRTTPTQDASSPAVPTQSPPPDARSSSANPGASARDLLGPPLVAPEPSLTPGDLVQAAPRAGADLPPASGTAVPTASRIVIHYPAGAESGELAQRLADQLRRSGRPDVELRPVAFEVGTASVRYFRVEDRVAAEKLVNALGPFLQFQGRPAPTAPVDFTDFRPQPRPGLLEIWLPQR